MSPHDPSRPVNPASESSHVAPAARFGSETVINPERRPSASLPASDDSQGPNSGVWTRLFPSENDVAVGLASPSPEGLQLGQFEIRERIGLGGMGAVFSAYDAELDRIVALKVLSPTQSRDVASVKRFQNEAKAAARLNHENVAKVFSVGEKFGLHYIAFEFVDGLNIRSLLNKRGKLSPSEALSYVLQIATALQHTAAAGVVHRDIKPSNIIVKPNGRAKLVDWGLARDVSESPASNDLTVAGTTLGTFDYISPEQAKDPRSVDVRSDIYSLGCTFYQMLTGEPPYGEGTVLQKLLDHQGKSVPDPHEKNPAVSPQMAAVVMKMMAAEPVKRYQAVENLIADLMLLATQLGLRGIPADSMIWDKPNQPAKSNSFLRQNAGLLGTAAVLIISVFLMDYFSRTSSSANRSSIVSHKTSPTPLDGTRTFPSDNVPVNNEKPFDIGLELGPTEYNLEKRGDNSIFPNTYKNDSLTSRPSFFEPIVPPLTGWPWNDSVSNKTPIENVVPENRQASDPLKNASTPNKEMASNNTTTDSTEPTKKNPVVTTPTNSMTTSPFAVILPDGKKIGKTYETLEGAVADATDGSVVELRFNGTLSSPRLERPFDITKKNITIRAGKGFLPVVKLYREKFDRPGMIRVTSGGLTIKNVQIIADVERKGVNSHWSFLLLTDPKAVRLQSVSITIDNPSRSDASFVEIVANPDEDFSDMMKPPGKNSSNQTPFLEIDSSIIRSHSDFIFYSHTESIRIDIRESAMAFEGTALINHGDDSFREEVGKIEFDLVHTTFLTNGGFIIVNRGELRRDAPSLQVNARNCIFGTTNSGESSFLRFEGKLSAEDFQEGFTWIGQQNFYDGFTEFLFWKSTDPSPPSLPAPDFEGWKEYTKSAPQLDRVVWKSENRDLPFVQWSLEQFLINTSDEENPAVSSGAGLNPELLPKSQVPQKPVPLHLEQSVTPAPTSAIPVPPALN